jgi:putative phosphoribosyl transferase
VPITFRVPASTAATVEVVGDFNDWQGGATPLAPNGDTLAATVALEPGRRYHFRYLLDGQRWDADPGADALENAGSDQPEAIIDLTGDHDGQRVPPAAARFAHRDAAGVELGERLRGRVGDDAVVLAVPSGGIPVGAALARTLGLALDVLDVHEVTAHRGDLAVGAVGSTGERALRPSTAHALGVTDEELEQKASAAEHKLTAIVAGVRSFQDEVSLAGREVVVVDDAIATTPAIAASAYHARGRGARRVLLAAPVAISAFVEGVARDFDEIVCLEVVDEHVALDEWFDQRDPIEDDQAVEIVRAAVGGQRSTTA